MKYTEKEIEEFADKKVEELMSEPIENKDDGQNIEVAYQLSGDMARYSDAIRNTNPNSRLFKATYEDEDERGFKELSSKSLYVVRPSVVVFDDTEYSFRKTRNISKSFKLSRYQIRCIKANLRKLRKKEIALESNIEKTEIDKLELEETKLTISNLEKTPLDKPTIFDYINNVRRSIANTKFNIIKLINVNNVTHIVKFENSIQDTTIAIGEPLILRDIVTSEVFYENIGSQRYEGEKCVNVFEGDKILLARYLWEKSGQSTKYNYEIEQFLLSLKPYYSTEEIMVILKQLKNEVAVKEEKATAYTLKRKSKLPFTM